jgi:hypothetical protein
MSAPAGSFSKRSRGGHIGLDKKDFTRDERRGGENHFDLTPFFEAVIKWVETGFVMDVLWIRTSKIFIFLVIF